jgi:hypothetical protein
MYQDITTSLAQWSKYNLLLLLLLLFQCLASDTFGGLYYFCNK